MKTLLPLLCSLPLFAATNGKIAGGNGNGHADTMQINGNGAATSAVPPPAMKSSMSSYMSIDPAFRAADLKEAFDLLRRETTSNKIALNLSNGEQITNMVEFTPTQNGTLIIVKYNSLQGVKELIVPIENISGLAQL